MRKEDKIRLPPKLKVKLPQGFHIERKPGEYLLYGSYPVVDDDHQQKGTMTDLMATFPANTPAQEIEAHADILFARLEEKLEHKHDEKA